MVEFIKLLLVFVLILLLIRRKVNIGLAMLVAAGVLGLLFQLPPIRIGQTAFNSAIDLATLDLLASLILILFLENVMRKTLLLQKMVSAVMALAGDRRLAMAMLPAFVGLLPSVGGAIFSAPMVEEASGGLGLSPERKSFINYWYRHLWEPILPVYPSIILISQILKVPVGTVIAVQFPLTIATILVGMPLAFRGLDTKAMALDASDKRQHMINLAMGLGPIAAVMVFVLVLKLEVWLSLLLVIVALILAHRYSLDQTVELIKEAFSWQIAILVIGVMVFKAMLQQSGAIDAIPPFLSSAGIPIAALVFILPFMVGLMTGLVQAPVALTFPIIAGLSTSGLDMRMMAFAFSSGYAGVMLSPTHMCFVLTVQHFKADFSKVLRMVAVPEAAVLLVGAAIYFVR